MKKQVQIYVLTMKYYKNQSTKEVIVFMISKTKVGFCNKQDRYATVVTQYTNEVFDIRELLMYWSLFLVYHKNYKKLILR